MYIIYIMYITFSLFTDDLKMYIKVSSVNDQVKIHSDLYNFQIGVP